MEFETNPFPIEEDDLDYIARIALYYINRYNLPNSCFQDSAENAIAHWFNEYKYDVEMLTIKGYNDLTTEIVNRIKEKTGS